MCGFGSGSDGGGAESRRAEQERSSRIGAGMQNIDNTFSKFNDSYYDSYAKKIQDYWMPDIERQATDANDKIALSFASKAPGGSSAASKAYGRLQEEKGRKIQEAHDNSRGEANKLRQNVEQQRGVVTSQLNATADPYAAARASEAQAAALSAEPVFSPLGNLFSDLTGQYAVAEKAAQQGAPGWGFSIGGPVSQTKKAGSMKVIG